MRAFVLALSAILISPLAVLAAVDQKECALEATNLLTDQESKAPVSFDENGKTIKGKPADIVTSRKLGRGQGEEITYILKVGPEDVVLKKVRNKVTIQREEGVLKEVTRTHNAHDEYEMVGKDKTRPLRYETSLKMKVVGDRCIVTQNLAIEAPWGVKPKDRQTVVYYDRVLCSNLQPLLKQEATVYDSCAPQSDVTSEKYKKDCNKFNAELTKVFADRTSQLKASGKKLKQMSSTAEIGKPEYLAEMYSYVGICKTRFTPLANNAQETGAPAAEATEGQH
ncbi:hypothetical protein D3C72_1154240 [compost metagenome]